MFGEKYVEDGKVIRKELGKIIFSNEENKLKLEALLHPLIEEEIVRQSKILEKYNKTYFIDIPLFYEKMHYPIPKSLLVYTPKDIQVPGKDNKFPTSSLTSSTKRHTSSKINET